MQDNEPIIISFMTEKIVGRGEDAPPLFISKGQTCAVGVFDGMGGAGATTCNSSIGDGHTKAYVASRIVASAMDVYLCNHLPTNDVAIEDMKSIIRRKLCLEKETYPPQIQTSLRTKLVRDYPTTLAIVTFHEYEGSSQVNSYWAGDSHCYLWNKDGFFQISKDDLADDNDPMENLHSDSPISNCICADRDFIINHKLIDLGKEPVIILCATDGCFGYFQTPMHFEYVLKTCLQESQNEKEWSDKIKSEISSVTGDDSSLSMMAIGFSSFDELKKYMRLRPIIGFPELKGYENSIAMIEQQLASEKVAYEKIMAVSWEKYKDNYMKYIID